MTQGRRGDKEKVQNLTRRTHKTRGKQSLSREEATQQSNRLLTKIGEDPITGGSISRGEIGINNLRLTTNDCWQTRITQQVTPLKASMSQIRAEAQQTNLVQYPHPAVKEPSQHPASLANWCAFHRLTGHETKKCTTLRWEIERLIKRRNLAKHVREGTGGNARQDYADNRDITTGNWAYCSG